MIYFVGDCHARRIFRRSNGSFNVDWCRDKSAIRYLYDKKDQGFIGAGFIKWLKSKKFDKDDCIVVVLGGNDMFNSFHRKKDTAVPSWTQTYDKWLGEYIRPIGVDKNKIALCFAWQQHRRVFKVTRETGEKYKKLNASIEKLAKKHGFQFINFFEPAERLLMRDGRHLKTGAQANFLSHFERWKWKFSKPKPRRKARPTRSPSHRDKIRKQAPVKPKSDNTRIFITGAPRSGGTLLLRMFYSFKNVDVLDRETHIRRLINAESDKKFIVARRRGLVIFADQTMEPKEVASQLKMMKSNKVKLIHVVRDGRDVLRFCHQADRWIGIMAQRAKYPNAADMEVRYEDLVLSPNKTQQRIAKKFGLEIYKKFSEYPDYVPNGVVERDLKTFRRSPKEGKHYKKTKINRNVIGVDPNAYKSVIKKTYKKKAPKIIKQFNQQLRILGCIK